MTGSFGGGRRFANTRRPAIVFAALVCLLSGCSSSSPGHQASALANGDAAPLPTTAPHLLMVNDGVTGWAVWPSGQEWVLLHTTDGWLSVTNATPSAVPTGGGLVVAKADNRVAVAVEPYDRLTQSPFLTGNGDPAAWNPAELPGAIIDSRSALTSFAAATTAVLRSAEGGTVVKSNATGWTTLTDAAKLAPKSGLKLDGISSASDSVGWITGHAPAGSPVAFQTTDGGTTWAPVQLPISSAVAALAPCGSGDDWLMPVENADGKVVIARTTDAGHSWVAGTALTTPSGSPVWGCHADTVWVAARTAHAADHVFASHDGGGTWTDNGPAPQGLTDLTPIGNGEGFASSTTSKSQTLWKVGADGGQFVRITLPGWVATLGAQMSES
ncbi:MAG: WD40/YVTN/BNR-like repeat-containing protein [Acidothermaceae bacterium]